MSFQPWVAFWFCAFLSLITVVTDLCLAFANRQPSHLGVLTTFLAFLPMCFYFMANFISRQQGELNELRAQLAALRSKTGV